MNQSNLLTVRVAGVMNRQAVVLHVGRTLPCLLSGRLLRQKDSLAVGDRAEAEVLGGGQYRLTRVLPGPAPCAAQPPRLRGALLAANADFVLAVCAAPSLLRAFTLPGGRWRPPGGGPARRALCKPLGPAGPGGGSPGPPAGAAPGGAGRPGLGLRPGASRRASPALRGKLWPCWAARGAARPP